MSKSQRRSGLGDSKSNTAADGPVASHKLLIDASVFNISLLLPPSLTFLQRLKDIVPPDSSIAISTLTSFLDDFLVNVFHPQLDEAVTELCMQSFSELEAFQNDPQWSQRATRPLFKVGNPQMLLIVERLTGQLGHVHIRRTYSIFLQAVEHHPRRPGFYSTDHISNCRILRQMLRMV